MNHYRPLPKSLTIKSSKIDGLGLYSTEDIKMNTELGITHIENENFENGYIRTPLGGFINYSETPNCKIIKNNNTLCLKVINNIKGDEELTLKYGLYDPTKIK